MMIHSSTGNRFILQKWKKSATCFIKLQVSFTRQKTLHHLRNFFQNGCTCAHLSYSQFSEMPMNTFSQTVEYKIQLYYKFVYAQYDEVFLTSSIVGGATTIWLTCAHLTRKLLLFFCAITEDIAQPRAWLPPHLQQMALTIKSDGGIHLAGLPDQGHPSSTTLTYLYSLHSRWGTRPASLQAFGDWLWEPKPAIPGRSIP